MATEKGEDPGKNQAGRRGGGHECYKV
jgi:hypothetical protein